MRAASITGSGAVVLTSQPQYGEITVKHEINADARLPNVAELSDEERQAINAARREIRAARRDRERAAEREQAATMRLARALAAAPRRIGRGRPPAGTLTVDELAELAGLESRQGVYDLIEKAEGGDAGGTTKREFGGTSKRSPKGGR